MSIAEIFKRAVVRRVAYLIVASLLAWLCIGRAHAQDYPFCGANPLVCTKEKAYTALVLPSNIKQVCESIYGVDPSYTSGSVKNIVDGYSGGTKAFMGDYKCTYTFPGNPPSTINGTSIVRYYVSDCPVGTEWFESLGKCDKPCSARNADLGGVNQPIRWSDSSADQCKSECIYKIVSDFQTRNVYVTSGGQSSLAGTRYGGIWEYTGDRCPIEHSEPKDEPPKPQCTPATHGQTYCITPDNKECYSASTGRTICWGPSEQGTKTDGPTIQEHMPGQQTPSAPPNTTYNSTTTVTTNVNNNSSQTTTNNYTTNNNAPAGPSNNGEPTNDNGEPTTPYNPYPGGNNGTGNGSGNGDGNGNDNASSGGGDCASAPVSSGDPLLAQIASQTWATRCAISDRNKQQDEQAESLKNADDGLGTVNESGIFGEGSDITGQLSESLIGGGGGQCATGWNLMGKPIELPDGFWSLASWIGMLIVALAYLWAAVLLSEG